MQIRFFRFVMFCALFSLASQTQCGIWSSFLRTTNSIVHTLTGHKKVVVAASALAAAACYRKTIGTGMTRIWNYFFKKVDAPAKKQPQTGARAKTKPAPEPRPVAPPQRGNPGPIVIEDPRPAAPAIAEPTGPPAAPPIAQVPAAAHVVPAEIPANVIYPEPAPAGPPAAPHVAQDPVAVPAPQEAELAFANYVLECADNNNIEIKKPTMKTLIAISQTLTNQHETFGADDNQFNMGDLTVEEVRLFLALPYVQTYSNTKGLVEAERKTILNGYRIMLENSELQNLAHIINCAEYLGCEELSNICIQAAPNAIAKHCTANPAAAAAQIEAQLNEQFFNEITGRAQETVKDAIFNRCGNFKNWKSIEIEHRPSCTHFIDNNRLLVGRNNALPLCIDVERDAQRVIETIPNLQYIAQSQDGQRIAFASDNIIEVRDNTLNEVIWHHQLPAATIIKAIKFTPDNAHLMIVAQERYVRDGILCHPCVLSYFNENANEIRRIALPETVPEAIFNVAAFSSNGEHLAISTRMLNARGTVASLFVHYSAQTGQSLHSQRTAAISSIKFCPNNQDIIAMPQGEGQGSHPQPFLLNLHGERAKFLAGELGQLLNQQSPNGLIATRTVGWSPTVQLQKKLNLQQCIDHMRQHPPQLLR